MLYHLADPVVPRSARSTVAGAAPSLCLFFCPSVSLYPSYLVLRNFVEREAGTLCPPNEKKGIRYRCAIDDFLFFSFLTREIFTNVFVTVITLVTHCENWVKSDTFNFFFIFFIYEREDVNDYIFMAIFLYPLFRNINLCHK